jgi:hypothetical protein
MNASMFGKNDESISASTYTNHKKDIYLYRSRNNNHQQITMTNLNSKISMVKSYDTFLSTVKGHSMCNDVSCNYTTYLDSSTDKIKTQTMDDWYVTQVDYTGIQLDASNNPIANSEMLGGTNWPYINTRGGEKDCGLKTPYFVENHTYLNTDLSNNPTIFTKKGTGAFLSSTNSIIYATNKNISFPNTKLNN